MRRCAAFSLVELLVTVAILAILAAFIGMAYGRVSAKAKATRCISHLRQLGLSLRFYLNDHDQTLPTLVAARASRSEDVAAIDNTLDAYGAPPEVMACPADDRELAAQTGTSYFWNPALNGQKTTNLTFLTIAAASRIPILSDKEGFHLYRENRVNILFGDGHASPDLRFIVPE